MSGRVETSLIPATIVRSAERQAESFGVPDAHQGVKRVTAQELNHESELLQSGPLGQDTVSQVATMARVPRHGKDLRLRKDLIAIECVL
jgi:hypothetical protein